jgi:hypothetical protein
MAPQSAGEWGSGVVFSIAIVGAGPTPSGCGCAGSRDVGFLVGLCLSTTPANAACAPDPASSGDTVTCSGNTPGGFQAGVSNLTVNVLSGATVSDGVIGVAISVLDFSTVNNSGTVTAGTFDVGIIASSDDNTVNNLAGGTITVGSNAAGISAQGNPPSSTMLARSTSVPSAPESTCPATTR